MIRITVTRAEYDQLAKFGRPLVVERRTVRRPQRTQLEVQQPDGEVLHLNSFRGGCGVRVGQAREIRWRREGGRRSRGGVVVIASEVQEIEPDVWHVTFVKRTPEAEDYFLAPAAGYTTNHTASIDREASAMYSPDVVRVVGDTQLARRDARKTGT